MSKNNNNEHGQEETRHGKVAGSLSPSSATTKEFDINNINTLSTTNQFNGKVPQLPKDAVLPENLGDDACPWLNEYIEFSRKWSPESFDGYHEGVGLFVLSTTAARRVVFDLGGEHATNLYIGLMGNTGVHSKSTAASIGIDLLRTAGLGMFLAPDSVTPQRLIEMMSSNYLPQNFNDLNKEDQENEIIRVLTIGQRGWFVDEFDETISTMMRPDSFMFGIKGLIRTLDGVPEEYKASTIGRGDNLVKYPYLTILGNITLAGMAPSVKKGSVLWGDGTLARFALITPSSSSINLGRFPNEKRKFPENLTTPLVDWHNRLGLPEYEVVGSENGLRVRDSLLEPHYLTINNEAYDAFYRYHDNLRKFIVDEIPDDLAGNYARIPEKALRCAALFASFGGFDSINLGHWAKGQAFTERLRVGLHEMYTQLSSGNQDSRIKFIKNLSVESQIIRAIVEKVMPTKREISQFTGFEYGILEPGLKKLISDGDVLAIQHGNTKKYIVPKENSMM